MKTSKAIKYDNDKLRFDLLDPWAIEALARVYSYGAEKYADRNMEKGLAWGRLYGACMRHLWAFWRGEDNDKESGLPHLAHAAWNCITLLAHSRSHRKLDDRPKSGR